MFKGLIDILMEDGLFLMQVNFTIRPVKPEDWPMLATLMPWLQETERELHINRSPGAEICEAHLAYVEALAREQK